MAKKEKIDASNSVQTLADTDDEIRYVGENAMKQMVESTKALVDSIPVSSAEDNDYVMKLVDAEGNLLQGFKKNGEIDAPIGIPDDDYTLHKAICGKLDDIATYLKYLNERVSKLENNN